MSEVPEPSPSRKWWVRAFLVLFVVSAYLITWYGYKQQQLHGQPNDGKPKDPIADQSLFGR